VASVSSFNFRGHKSPSDRVSKILSFSALIVEKLEIPTT
jgi:hypothetical protein